MENISAICPRVFFYFAELCAIPHGSGNTTAIGDYCMAFAAAHGLFCHRDGLGNILIKKPGTQGYEHAKPVILQGHLDMVCEKEQTCPIDFKTDGLTLLREGDFLHADGTSLGADDGIAVAMTLAVLESRDIAHPPIEAVFTVDEEVGMDGANGLDGGLIEGRRLLNIDSDTEGVLIAGCAGGASVSVALDLEEGCCADDCCRLQIAGLRGGHSGEEIHKGRANAAVLLGRVVSTLRKTLDARLVSAKGGEKENAIASYAEAYLALPDAQFEQAAAIIRAAQETFRREYAQTDPDITLSLTPGGICDRALSAQATQKVCLFLLLCLNGIYRMSHAIEGLVQSSDNLGIFSLRDGRMMAKICVRSMLESEKTLLTEKIRLLAEALGGSAQVGGIYPAWEYREDSALRKTMVSCYRAQYGKEPEVAAIHAGLECGILCGKLPGLDAVSFGPDILEIHTVREHLRISSTERTWKYLLSVLAALQ